MEPVLDHVQHWLQQQCGDRDPGSVVNVLGVSLLMVRPVLPVQGWCCRHQPTERFPHMTGNRTWFHGFDDNA
jgi:hypothetical protein